MVAVTRAWIGLRLGLGLGLGAWYLGAFAHWCIWALVGLGDRLLCTSALYE